MIDYIIHVDPELDQDTGGGYVVSGQELSPNINKARTFNSVAQATKFCTSHGIPIRTVEIWSAKVTRTVVLNRLYKSAGK